MSARGALLVVGGHSRHVGKTAVMLEVLRALPGVPWVAIKVSAHRHHRESGIGPILIEERSPAAGTATARYLSAGARRAFLFRVPDALMAHATALLSRLRARGHHLLVESNRVVAHATPDLTMFVIDPGIADWKISSAACLRQADAVAIAGGRHVPACAVRVGGARVLDLPAFALVGPDRQSALLRQWLAGWWARSGREYLPGPDALASGVAGLSPTSGLQ